MEGLQGFGWGVLVAWVVTWPVAILLIKKAFIDGHIAGQKSMGAVDPFGVDDEEDRPG